MDPDQSVYTPAKLGGVPKTPITTIRIPPHIKGPAAEKAASENRTLTDVVVDALREYIREPDGTKPHTRSRP